MKEEYDSNLENLHKQNESVELKYNSLLHQHQQLESQLKLIETSTLSKLQLREEQEKDHQELVKQFNKLQKQNNEQAIAIQDLQEKLSRSSTPSTPKKRKAEEISDVVVEEKIPIAKETDDDDSKRGNVRATPKNKKRNRTPSPQPSKKKPKIAPAKKEEVPPAPIPPKSRCVIEFSNFKERTDYSIELKDRLGKYAEKLGAEIKKDSIDFEDDVTHVVCPPKSRTLKTLAALVTCRWVVTAEWIIESNKAGKFLPETLYGVKPAQKPYANKKFYITNSFKAEKKMKLR